MKDSLLTGLTITKKIEVNRDRTIGFMGDEGRVYSTPSMVEDIEYTCHELIQSHLDEGENTVGTHVSVAHIAATVEGDTVEVTITVNKKIPLQHSIITYLHPKIIFLDYYLYFLTSTDVLLLRRYHLNKIHLLFV